MNWVYKCNSRGLSYQRDSGDWTEFFQSPEAKPWGSTESVPSLTKAKPGDTILALQSNRNELVGVAVVVAQQRRRKFHDLVLKPVKMRIPAIVIAQSGGS